MRNIHVITTDKPSNIVSATIDGKLKLNNNANDSVEYNGENQNIYITNDEEIKVGDYYINTFVSEREQNPQTHTEKRHLINHQKDYRFKYCKKIILTTDQDLIKDGVQAIDDDFLEWFVQNQSCESIEVNLLPYDGTKSISKYWGGEYKIIIPKSTQEQVNFTKPNIIDDWLDKNGNPEISKQVEQEAEEFCKKQTFSETEKMKQTSVEWLIKNLETLNLIKEGDLENELFRQLELDAKEMEKQQITSAYNQSTYQFANDAEVIAPKSALEYYTKTYMTDEDKEKLLDKNNNSEITKKFNKESKDVFDELDKEIIKKYLK
jgi:hypothetical protein